MTRGARRSAARGTSASTPPGASAGAPRSTPRRAPSLLRSSPSGPVDSVLAALVIALIGFGVVMVYSASAIEATVRHHDAAVLPEAPGGLRRSAPSSCMWLVEPRRLPPPQPLTYPILLAVTAHARRSCVAGFGHRAGNAYRWIAIGPIHIQPAETAKLGIVIWLAYSLSKKADKIKSFTVGFLPHLLVVGVLMLLCLKQPDFGSAVVLLFLTFTLLFVAGAKRRLHRSARPSSARRSARPCSCASASTATSATSPG